MAELSAVPAVLRRDHPLLPERLFRWFARPTFRLAFRLLSDVRLEGRACIPCAGPYLVAGNHLSLYEPPLLLAFWPEALEVIGAADVLERPGQGTLMRWYGALPVRRQEADRAMLKAAIRRLKAGRSLLIFPEGGRSPPPGLRQAWAGVAYIAEKASVPVLPVAVTGTEVLLGSGRHGRPTLCITIGEALRFGRLPPVGTDRKRQLQQNTERIMQAIAGLLPEAYRGIYA
jgi:1-acyl-sn-glycerol-3-phosphate acyltransferase